MCQVIVVDYLLLAWCRRVVDSSYNYNTIGTLVHYIVHFQLATKEKGHIVELTER